MIKLPAILAVGVTMHPLDVWVFVGYLSALLFIGAFVSYRHRKSEDLFLAGRSLGWANVGLSIWGTNISPSMMISSCGVAFSSGMVAANFSWMAWPFLILR